VKFAVCNNLSRLCVHSPSVLSLSPSSPSPATRFVKSFDGPPNAQAKEESEGAGGRGWRGAGGEGEANTCPFPTDRNTVCSLPRRLPLANMRIVQPLVWVIILWGAACGVLLRRFHDARLCSRRCTATSRRSEPSTSRAGRTRPAWRSKSAVNLPGLGGERGRGGEGRMPAGGGKQGARERGAQGIYTWQDVRK